MAPLSALCTGLRGQAAGERDRRQRRDQPVAPYAHAYATVVASHRLRVEGHRRRHARGSCRICAGRESWPMRPTSLGST
eukprot:3309328-Pleurochrysis_carterae.AAC.1